MYQEQVRFEIGKIMYEYRMSEKDAAELVSLALSKGKDYVGGFENSDDLEALGEMSSAIAELLKATVREKLENLIKHINITTSTPVEIIIAEVEKRAFPTVDGEIEPPPSDTYFENYMEGYYSYDDKELVRSVLFHIREYRESLSSTNV